MKLTISDKDGKSYQVEVPSEKVSSLLGLKIGNEFEGGIVGAGGYTLKVTGGSDNAGFPMRADIDGPRRAKILLSGGAGFNPSRKGERARKKVHGNQIDAEISQLNSIVLTPGPQKLEELFPKKEGEKKKEEKKAPPKKKKGK